MYRDLTGRNIDGQNLYAEFERKYNKNKESFDKIIGNFDQNGVELKAAEEEEVANPEKASAKKKVDSMAKRASTKLLKKKT
jgi:hypothetical protein